MFQQIGGTATLTAHEERPAVDPPVPARRLSTFAETIRGSEVLGIAAEIRALQERGRAVCNLTMGDFSPSEFRIPEQLRDAAADAYRRGETNYPPADGIAPLRNAVLDLYARDLGLRYDYGSVCVASGSRPVLYAAYRTLVDAGDRVVFPVPSWNNDHYCRIVGAEPVPVACGPADGFLPTRARLEQAVRGARMLALNSPANPTGTLFDAEGLGAICDLVLEENARRGPGERPLFLLYDQVYWSLVFGEAHVDPVTLRPELRPLTVFVDGISKAFAATGLRVGWGVGPEDVIRRMAPLVGHMGAMSPRPEQVATARLLGDPGAVADFRGSMIRDVRARLDALYAGMRELGDAGLPVEAFEPRGAIYLSVRLGVLGRRTREGETIATNEQLRRYLLHAAGVAAIPFEAFGATDAPGWFRFSVGAVSPGEIAAMVPRLRFALERLEG